MCDAGKPNVPNCPSHAELKLRTAVGVRDSDSRLPFSLCTDYSAKENTMY